MTTATDLVIRPLRGELAPSHPSLWTAEEIETLKRTIAKGVSDEEFALFANVCRATGLSPWAKQIWAILRYDRRARREVMTIQFSIDGLRLVAQRSGCYAGQRGPYWCGPDGQWGELWDGPVPPTAAKAIVLRLLPNGALAEFPAVCTWAQFAQYYVDKETHQRELAGLWGTSFAPHMLAIRAESHALRKAFPAELAWFESTLVAPAGGGASSVPSGDEAGELTDAEPPAIAVEVVPARASAMAPVQTVRSVEDPADSQAREHAAPPAPTSGATPAPAAERPATNALGRDKRLSRAELRAEYMRRAHALSGLEIAFRPPLPDHDAADAPQLLAGCRALRSAAWDAFLGLQSEVVMDGAEGVGLLDGATFDQIVAAIEMLRTQAAQPGECAGAPGRQVALL